MLTFVVQLNRKVMLVAIELQKYDKKKFSPYALSYGDPSNSQYDIPLHIEGTLHIIRHVNKTN